MIKVGILAGERSGDILGSGLIKALKKIHPDIEFEGIGGPLMQAEGCRSLFEMERLSVMGYVEPLSRLPELYNMRKHLIKHFIKNKPDVFIGIDSPGFNIGLEMRLKAAGIKVVHYVSPSVWAWRKKRIFKIKKAVDMVLTLLPFENKIYDEHNIANCFVGHPLADDIPLELDTTEVRKKLGLPLDKTILAILPGSRGSEVKYLAEPFLKAAQLLKEKCPDVHCVVPLATPTLYEHFNQIKNHLTPDLPITLLQGQSRDAMGASDLVLLSSGTATLEAMLLAKPMVVAYKFSLINYHLAKWLVKTPYFSLPNLLANKPLVPELFQQDVTPEILMQHLLKYLESPAQTRALVETFKRMHVDLQQGASEKAARAVLELC